MRIAVVLLFVLMLSSCNGDPHPHPVNVLPLPDTLPDAPMVDYMRQAMINVKHYNDSVDVAMHAMDSVITDTVCRIHGRNYNFNVFRDIGGTMLTIRDLSDAGSKYELPIDVDWGDCNARTQIKAGYELQGDSLVYYASTCYVDQWDFSHIASQTIRSKEIYIFRKNGELIRVNIFEAKTSDDPLWKLVEERLLY